MDQDLSSNDPFVGQKMPRAGLPETDGLIYHLSAVSGIIVIYIYPRTSPPNAALIDGWDMIPGTRGRTPPYSPLTL